MPATEHIIDVLIAERAPRLRASPFWPLLKPTLYRLLDYAKARALAEAVAPMGGREAMDHLSSLLRLRVDVRGLERAPARGPLVVVCNHPTGLADGVAVYDALRRRRPDIAFYANADAHRVAPRLDDVLFPVEWVEAKRTRERARLTLALTKAAFEAERALVIFPAGRLARRRKGGRLADLPWQSTPVSLARRYGAAIVPVHLSGPWPFLFHAFDGLSPELRDITLFHELLNKRGRAFRLTVGAPIPPQALEGDAGEVIARLKHYTERVLPEAPDQPFP